MVHLLSNKQKLTPVYLQARVCLVSPPNSSSLTKGKTGSASFVRGVVVFRKQQIVKCCFWNVMGLIKCLVFIPPATQHVWWNATQPLKICQIQALALFISLVLSFAVVSLQFLSQWLQWPSESLIRTLDWWNFFSNSHLCSAAIVGRFVNSNYRQTLSVVLITPTRAFMWFNL